MLLSFEYAVFNWIIIKLSYLPALLVSLKVITTIINQIKSYYVSNNTKYK